MHKENTDARILEEEDNTDQTLIDLLASMAASLADVAKTLRTINTSLTELVTRDETPPWVRRTEPEDILPTVSRSKGALPFGSAQKKKYSRTQSKPAQNTRTPACPDCESPLVHRTSSRGSFWGCSKFPRCRGTRPFQEQEYEPDPSGNDDSEEGPF